VSDSTTSSNRDVLCWARSSSRDPLAASTPFEMITTSSQSCSTTASWWPENGSSRISTAGSCTSAAAICTRCWLPSDSASSLSPARSVSSSSASSRSVLAFAVARSRPCSLPSQVTCSATFIFGYSPRSSGM
jgi:hypothetical protein